VLLVPVNIDNVNPPSACHALTCAGLDVDADYQRMLDQLCADIEPVGICRAPSNAWFSGGYTASQPPVRPRAADMQRLR